MKILQTINGLCIESGGTSSCTYELVKSLNEIRCATDILSLHDNSMIGNNEQWIKTVYNDSVSNFYYSHNVKKFLIREHIYSLYHTNGLWTYCNHITCEIAKRKKKPYIITPHGMLYPQALQKNKWGKKLALSIFFKKDLENANCIHCTCEEEKKYCRALGFKNPIAIIPNIVNIPAIKNTNIERKKNIGFLGRLHPRKKVENIIYAWCKIKRDESELLIMGTGDIEYETFLKKEVQRLNLKNVIFTGFVSGQDKFEKLASISALCVPSNFENFGMIVPEALSVGTPVIASKGTPWQILNDNKCGWWVDNTPDTLAKAMEIALNLSKEKMIYMGDIGKQLVKDEFSSITVASKMKRLYEWIINKEEKPEFVYLCNK